MIIPEGTTKEMLLRYHEGKIEHGLGLEIPDLDRHLRFKRSQFNIILGHDNSGKTYWANWYFLALSSHHDLTWTLWEGENKAWAIQRDLIQIYSGKYFKDLSYKELTKWQMKIEYWFKFVDNSKLYTPEQMLDVFDSQKTDGFFMDPFTGLDRNFTHEANYQFLNKARQFVNQTGKTLYMSTHPNSESARGSRVYPKSSDYAGHIMPPLKDHIEGGKPFVNRCDDFIIVHRLIKHDLMKYTTMVDIAKVKDTETGGRVTGMGEEIYHEFNSGLGFKVGFKEGIKRKVEEAEKPVNTLSQELKNFYEPLEKVQEENLFSPPDKDCPF